MVLTSKPHTTSSSSRQFRSSYRPIWNLLLSFTVIGALFIVILQEERSEVRHSLEDRDADHGSRFESNKNHYGQQQSAAIAGMTKISDEKRYGSDGTGKEEEYNMDPESDDEYDEYDDEGEGDDEYDDDDDDDDEGENDEYSESEPESSDEDDDESSESESDSSDARVRPSIGDGRPPLNTLIKDLEKGIIGPVDWLLDFAVLGHSKCGTTETLHWLGGHKDVVMYDHEIHSLGQGHPAELVKYLYELPQGDYLRGYKSPHELQRLNSVSFLRKYWPSAKIIVGLRHPVKWFASYYNFNYRMGNKLPPAETYVGANFAGGVMYHEHLFRLGKTNTTDPIEYTMVGRTEPETMSVMPNHIFLYEVSQPFDHNLTKREIYAQDMTDFLNLSSVLPVMNTRPGDTSSGNYNFKLDICRPKYKALRQELTTMGKNASEWLKRYFLVLPDVKVSSRETFTELINTWSLDPCEEPSLTHVR